MRLFVTSLLLLGLLAPGWALDDPPKKDEPPAKEEKKSPADEFKAIQAELSETQAALRTKYMATTDDKEKQKLLQENAAAMKELAGRCLKLAEANANDPIAADVLIFAGSRMQSQEAFKALADGFASKADLAALNAKLGRMRFFNAEPLCAKVVERVARQTDHPQALDLLIWVSNSAEYTPGSPAGKKAGELLFEKFIESEKLGAYCKSLANSRDAKSLERAEAIAEKSPHAKVKAAAVFAVAGINKNLSEARDLKEERRKELEGKAEAAYDRLLKEFAEADKALAQQAKGALNELRYLSIGKTIIDVAGPDLDDKEFKISDYRGKVILLDFWAHW